MNMISKFLIDRPLRWVLKKTMGAIDALVPDGLTLTTMVKRPGTWFTLRDGDPKRLDELKEWCTEHGLPILPQKGYGMSLIPTRSRINYWIAIIGFEPEQDTLAVEFRLRFG